jgi:hypothetical protein
VLPGARLAPSKLRIVRLRVHQATQAQRSKREDGLGKGLASTPVAGGDREGIGSADQAGGWAAAHKQTEEMRACIHEFRDEVVRACVVPTDRRRKIPGRIPGRASMRSTRERDVDLDDHHDQAERSVPYLPSAMRIRRARCAWTGRPRTMELTLGNAGHADFNRVLSSRLTPQASYREPHCTRARSGRRSVFAALD